MMIRLLDSGDAGFDEALDALLGHAGVGDDGVSEAVAAILADVRGNGDAAVLEYTRRFDRREVGDIRELEISRDELGAAFARLEPELRSALRVAADRVRAYHQRQRQESWQYAEADGTVLGQQVTALDRVGVYVPGGRAAYPSSVLMNVVPAHVAGVAEIVMVVPAPDGVLNDAVLGAASVAGVGRVFTIGGAQAIAALAYGTQTIPAVDKIVGPGNAWVASAKRQVFGTVGIDMVAGPSEVLVIADASADPDWVAMDMFAQCEHDEDAQALLVSPDAGLLDAVRGRIGALLPGMERREIIEKSLAARGAMIRVGDLDEAVSIANRIAPEHLELAVDDPQALLAQVRHAGAIFLGHWSAEALGDYCAGPNHVLPTARTARFSSPLGVYDFQKRSSIIHCSEAGARELGRVAALLARSEGLQAHARSAGFRAGDPDGD